MRLLAVFGSKLYGRVWQNNRYMKLFLCHSVCMIRISIILQKTKTKKGIHLKKTTPKLETKKAKTNASD